MKNVQRTCTVAVLSMLLLACGGSDPLEPVNRTMRRVQAYWPAMDVKQAYTVRSDVEWQRVWLTHEPLTLPKTERPSVDFSNDMVVGLSLGAGSNGCYGMAIRRVIEEQRELRVEYLSSTPSGLALCTMAIVALTDFVVVTKSDKPVYFVQVGS